MRDATKRRNLEPTNKVFFFVLGYGTGWTTRYAAYLDQVAELYHQLHPQFLTLSGGVTAKPDPGLSEAEWMARGLVERGVPREMLRLEEKSRTTIENFQWARNLGFLPTTKNVVIFCDRFRRPKVRALAHRLGLEVRRLVHVPIEAPMMGRAVWLKSLFDAARLLMVGLPPLQST